MSLFKNLTPGESEALGRWTMKNSSPPYDNEAEDRYVADNREKFAQHAAELAEDFARLYKAD